MFEAANASGCIRPGVTFINKVVAIDYPGVKEEQAPAKVLFAEGEVTGFWVLFYGGIHRAYGGSGAAKRYHIVFGDSPDEVFSFSTEYLEQRKCYQIKRPE